MAKPSRVLLGTSMGAPWGLTMGSCWEFPQEPVGISSRILLGIQLGTLLRPSTGNSNGVLLGTQQETHWGPSGSLRGDSAGIPAETPPLLTPKWLINCESTGKPTESPHGHPKGIPSRILLGTTMVQLGFLLRAPQSHTGSPHGCLTRIPSGLLLGIPI